ncbi:hypothetical protein [Sulfurimonas sp.]|nr:hypothetical protein [Sulfurimonas sp.]
MGLNKKISLSIAASKAIDELNKKSSLKKQNNRKLKKAIKKGKKC